MKKLLLVACVLTFAASASSSFALSFSVYSATDTASINAWMGSNSAVVIEDFEDETSGWYGNLVTDIGTFTAGGTPGTGKSAYPQPDPQNPVSKFSIKDNGPQFGRTNVTAGGEKWLDSADIGELTLNLIDKDFSTLFFYLSDPSDVTATTTIEGQTTEAALGTSFFNKPNGTVWFVGITLNDTETLETIKWLVDTTNDGYGLDDFGATTAAVPEPATMLLFGTGLLGLAGLSRRRKAKK